MSGGDFTSLCHSLGERLRSLDAMMVTVESCTGGGIAYHLTDIAGSSDWFDRSYVTYSNSAKTELVGVPAELIEAHGAVSLEVAEAMATGALAQSKSLGGSGGCYAVSVTGVAGPGGGTQDKPVGTVCFGWAWCSADAQAQGARLLKLDRQCFAGDRQAIRTATIQHSLHQLLSLLKNH